MTSFSTGRAVVWGLAMVLAAGGCFSNRRDKKQIAEHQRHASDTADTVVAPKTQRSTPQPKRLDNREEQVVQHRRQINQVEVQRQLARSLYEDGLDLIARERWEPAVETLQKAVNMDDGDPLYFAALGQSYAGLGDDLSAIRAWEQCETHLLDARATSDDDERTIQGHLAQLTTLRALAWRRLGREENALRDFGRALEYWPDFVPALLELGAANLQQGRLDQAGQLLYRAEQLDPENADVQLRLTILELNRGNPNRAWQRATALQRRGFALNKDLLLQLDAARRRHNELGGFPG